MTAEQFAAMVERMTEGERRDLLKRMHDWADRAQSAIDEAKAADDGPSGVPGAVSILRNPHSLLGIWLVCQRCGQQHCHEILEPTECPNVACRAPMAEHVRWLDGRPALATS